MINIRLCSCLLVAISVASFQSSPRPRGCAAFKSPSRLFMTENSRISRGVVYGKPETADNVALHTVRGGQYFLPAEQLEQRHLQHEWSSVSHAYGFSEYSLGVLAYAELFKSNHDVTNKEHRNELYSFSDRKGRRLALRGDVTPQFMAMLRSHREGSSDCVLKASLSPPQLSKWFTVADCWRYERPGHCRRRNHLQWTCDIVGIPGEAAEVELLTMLVTFFRKYDLSSDDVAIHLNHRQSTAALMNLLGKPADDSQWMYEFMKVMDKYRKISKEEFTDSLSVLGFTPAESERLSDIISGCTTIADLEKVFSPNAAFVDNLRNIVAGLKYAKSHDWVTIDLSIVRGNDYYTGVVFECFDRHNHMRRAIAGGGRYDNYFGPSGTTDRQLSYAVGFGMGNVAIVELLRDRGIKEQGAYADVVVFTPASDGDRPGLPYMQSLYTMIDRLRQRGLKVYQYYKTPKWQKALEFAEKAGAGSFVHPHVDATTGKLTYQVHDIRSKKKVTVPGEDADKVVEFACTPTDADT